MADQVQHGSDQPRVGHLVPWTTLLLTCFALMCLTVLTVYVAEYVDLGRFNIWLALIIATLKASLVCLYFMHLRYDRSFNAIVLIVAILTLMLFIGLALLDTNSYADELYRPDWDNFAPAITQQRDLAP